MTTTLIKQPAEGKTYDFQFAPVMPDGRTLASASVVQVNENRVSGSSALVLGSVTVSGTLAQVKVSSGTDGERYKLTASGTDNVGDTHEIEGFLAVRDI